MEQQNIAIIGLGRIGSAFLEEMLKKKAGGIRIACVAEFNETAGRALAEANGIQVVTLDDIVAMGNDIDVIFDLTGLPTVRKELREKLTTANNRHTVIASETIMRVIWALISDSSLPFIAGRKVGY
ncbi:MAG: NAD(P)-binding domain-containing protein [Polyangiaceae bacterium]|nr:NAD(P)-binding domain-containing protein [Polyangiaceae bacterium]